MLKNIMNILRDKFLTVRDLKKIAKSKKFLKKSEETLIKVSAQSEHFYILVVKGLVTISYCLKKIRTNNQHINWLGTIMQLYVI